MPVKVCILGVGKSGVAAARHAIANGDDVTVYAGMSTQATKTAAQEFIDQGIEVLFDNEDVKGHFDQCVVCPGIPQTGGFYKSALAASDELMSEPEYAWRISPKGWVAITGTNGKTTTTSLSAHILNECGVAAAACGNIGDTALAAVENRADGQVLVAEMSSYQIASTSRFAPECGVLLNITPDHLTWHGSFESYAQAKYKLFDNFGPGQTAIIEYGCLGADELAAKLRSRGVRVVDLCAQTGDDCAFVSDDGKLVVRLDGREHVLCAATDLQIKGEHNVQNALASAAVALSLGCGDEKVACALVSFSALEHRVEPCGEVDGIKFYNDSKGTNVDATLKALTAFEDGQVVLMVGGRDKGTSLDELVEACAKKCAAVICYGEGGPRFYEAFSSVSTRRGSAPTMRTAFELARAIATPGQVVLLSPACASFDEFKSYEERGEVFKSYVAELLNRRA